MTDTLNGFRVGEVVEVRSRSYADDGEGWHVGTLTQIDDYDSCAQYRVASAANTDGDGWDWINVNDIRKFSQATPRVQYRFADQPWRYLEVPDEYTFGNSEVEFRYAPPPRTEAEILAEARRVAGNMYDEHATLNTILRGEF